MLSDRGTNHVAQGICTSLGGEFFPLRSNEGLTLADMEHAVDEGIGRLRMLLSPQNAKAYLADLPQEVDVVAVEPAHSQVHTHRYLQ